MIEPKKKICSKCGTPQYLFSGGMCRYCWGVSKMNAPKPPHDGTAPPIKYKIPNRTKKRKDQELEYSILCGIIDTEAKESGKWKCFFCDGKIKGTKADHHHLLGREGDALIRKENIVIAHRNCHAQYHQRSIHDIHWYVDWLERIQISHPWLYEKELIKYNK